MSNARRIVKQLEGDWRGDFGLVPGPGHSPKDRSLSVRDSADGHDVIFNSFAGEDWRPIKDRLRAEGMLPEMTRGSTSTASPPTVYTYRDQDGAPVFRIVRNPNKRFAAEHPDSTDGSWNKGLGGTTPVPYRLPEILAAHPDETIFVVEGEKDADNLAALGCIATTNPFGAGKWSTAFSPHLAGRDVVILPDNDDAGRAHAKDVANKLAGHARSVAIVPLPGLFEKGDVSDWLAAGEAGPPYSSYSAMRARTKGSSRISPFGWKPTERRCARSILRTFSERSFRHATCCSPHGSPGRGWR